MTTAQDFADAFKQYRIASMLCDSAESVWDEDPENEIAESAFDAAYRMQHERFDDLVAITTAICSPLVEGFTAKTARTMLMKNEEKVAEMVARLAA